MPGGTRNRAMTEADLGEHVRKAVNPVETAPKQKHVRSIRNKNIPVCLIMRRLYSLFLGPYVE